MINNFSSLAALHRVIAVIRSPQLELGLQMAASVAAGGIRLIEITWTSHNPGDLITKLQFELPNCTIGVGTIVTLQQLQEAIACGAKFVFSPHTNLEIISAGVAARIPMIPGALSPTEIVTAWQAGASCVKVFPIQAVGGVSYIKSLKVPLGEIPLIPTGGVTFANACEFIQAGAIAVGLSGELFPPELIKAQDWTGITQRAKMLKELVTIAL